MKTLSLMALATALSLGLAAGTPASAATYKPTPGAPAAIKYLQCESTLVLDRQKPGGAASQGVRITNTSGMTLKAGTPIYVGYAVNGQQKQYTKYLSQDLSKGSFILITIGAFDQQKGCTAQVNLLYSQPKIPKPPIPGRPGPGSGPKPH